ncbi:MAG: hypothetical protein Q9224_002802 [Gallowayella concinna]
MIGETAVCGCLVTTRAPNLLRPSLRKSTNELLLSLLGTAHLTGSQGQSPPYLTLLASLGPGCFIKPDQVDGASAMDPPGTKYRASCDGCYLAKVKCTKERPSCPRCKNLGLECKYSPSQRAGKSRRPKVQVSPISQSSEWPTHSQHGSQPSNMLPSPAHTHSQQHFGEGSSFPSDGPSPHPSHLDAAFTENSSGGTAASMLRDLDDINFFTPWRDYLPSLNPEFSLSESTTDSAGFTNASTATTATTPISTPASHFSKDPEPMQMTTTHLADGCNCITTLAQALQIMQAQSCHPNNTRPTLESILEDNRDVVARGETLLHCICFDDSTTIMLFTALIAKHLTFYGTFLTTDLLESPLHPHQQHNDHRPCSSSSSAIPLTTAAPLSSTSAATSRLTIGTYTLDAAGEERLRIKIMMMELQKLGSLLGKIRSKLSALPVGYEGRTYETVIDFLNTRLREATDRLRTLKKKMKGEDGVV